MSGLVQLRNDQMVELLSADFQKRYEPNFAWKSACSQYLALTGLRGFWPMSSLDENGDAHDLSAQDRTMSYNGNPTYNLVGLAPYLALDGTGDYLDRADEAGLDIEGDESYVGTPGLTLGGWFYISDAASEQYLIAKWDGANECAYALVARGDVANDPARFYISDDGTNSDNVSLVGFTVNTWHFIAGRFNDADTGEELKIWIDGESNTAATARDTIADTDANFTIGGDSGGSNLLTGRASMCFICAAALSDVIVLSLYWQTKAMFGV